MGDDALTEGQARFVAEYAVRPNATRAYLRAYPGCTYHTARGEAARLLANPSIRAELKAARALYKRELRVRAARLLRELAAVAFADPADLFRSGPDGGMELRPWREVPAAARAAVAGFRVRRWRERDRDGREWEVEEVVVRFRDKVRALDRLGRRLGLEADGPLLGELLAELRAGEGEQGRA